MQLSWDQDSLLYAAGTKLSQNGIPRCCICMQVIAVYENINFIFDKQKMLVLLLIENLSLSDYTIIQNPESTIIETRHEKTCLCHMRTTKT